MMPDMDGYTVLAKLRESPAFRDVPVIFVTAMDSREDEQRGLELGAADYITKPISPAIVLARVRTQIEAKAARDLLKRANLQLVHQVLEGVHALEEAHLQLLQSNKMAAIGQLAAGVAHEINNPIAFVGSNLGSLGGYLQNLFSIIAAYENAATLAASDNAFDEARRLRRELDYDYLKKDVADLLRETSGGLERVRKIVVDLKNFSRIDKPDWQWSDIHECLDSTLNIVWNEPKYHCTVSKNYGSLPQIRCLPSQINQVFMTLLVNAGPAIEGSGEITITTECVGDSAVHIQISDTGVGIEAPALASVFNPFYTTKPVGKGTGLGLSLSWGIVQRHAGTIEATSEAGKGATFTVTLLVEPKSSTWRGLDSAARPKAHAAVAGTAGTYDAPSKTSLGSRSDARVIALAAPACATAMDLVAAVL
ncbi:ATP-binding protein [Candidatus Accumulibacter sp. ACC003]|uniref:ATP-binding protein n=1 Tax=Candidatus Accumulibacter sp. ACC003 TaxID=2823334 RepID=UPI0025C6703C|nr:ATP-binding protein [Candidatus Accumulibacter sp. ACC003]